MVADAGLAALVAALFVAVAGIGFVPSNGVALALEHHGADAGTASALIGVVQFMIGGLAAPLPGHRGRDGAADGAGRRSASPSRRSSPSAWWWAQTASNTPAQPA